jgi:redox-sensitive bicupin YhaK (pirin superfamily)
MSAGTGIRHSEFNPSATEPVHLYQIWLLPNQQGLTPSYEQKAIATGQNEFRLVAAPDGRDGALAIYQDAELYLADLAKGASVARSLRPNRAAWLQVLLGDVALNGQSLTAGDGVAITDESILTVLANADAKVLLFDLA